MAKLYLHMGFHKTASTSFQETCRFNVDQLSELGVLYPLFHLFDNPKTSNHSMPICSIFAKQQGYKQFFKAKGVLDVNATIEGYHRYLGDCLLTGKDIIISGEDISLLEVDELNSLKDLIESYSYEIVPLAVVRSPYAYHCSFVQQRVKAGIHFDLTAFISQIEKIENIFQVFDNVKFLSMRDICKHEQGPVGFLLDFMGLDSKNFNIYAANEGVSNEFVRVKNLLNNINPLMINGQLNKNHIQIDKRQGKKFLLTEEEYQIIKTECEAENEYFLNQLGTSFCDGEIKFSLPMTQKNVADYFLNEPIDFLPKSYASLLRDLALTIEASDIEQAYRLMEAANILKPEGPFIARKLVEYKKIRSSD